MFLIQKYGFIHRSWCQFQHNFIWIIIPQIWSNYTQSDFVQKYTLCWHSSKTTYLHESQLNNHKHVASTWITYLRISNRILAWISNKLPLTCSFYHELHTCEYPIVISQHSKSIRIIATHKYELLSPQIKCNSHFTQIKHSYLIHTGIVLYLQSCDEFFNSGIWILDLEMLFLWCRRWFDLFKFNL